MASHACVVIVTSDGYEAWGRAADPVGAATDYMLVDAFTRFLEKRVVTQNMALLRRMMAEYFCHCETTVRQFIAQCSTQISIGPLDAEDPNDVAEAARVLHQPRSFARSGLSASVFTFLVTKLRAARASLLMQFFVDFCQGKDTALCEFIEKREGFVSILPLAAPQLEHSPFALSDSIPFESVDPLPMPPPPTTTTATTPKNSVSTKASKPVIQPAGKKRKAITREQYDHRSRGEDEEDADKQSDTSAGVAESHMDKRASDEDQPDLTAFSTRFNHPDEAINKVKAKLVAAMVEIEAHEPWTKVFSSKMAMPFDEAAHPDLARMLREFWRWHARAAWERNFWAPLRPETNASETVLRRARQRYAVVAFERIITACFEQFRAKFFYKLDRKREPGWWYRGTCVDLLGLSSIVGYDKCLEYVKAQQYTRFPDCGHPLPLRSANIGVVQLHKEAQVSQSLWLLTSKPDIQAIKNKFAAYVAKKNKKKRLKKAAKLSDKQAATVKKPKARASSVPVTLTPGIVRARKAVKASNNREQEEKEETAEAPAPETTTVTLGGGKQARGA